MRKNKSVLTYYDDESPWTTELRRLARNIRYSGFAGKRLLSMHRNTQEAGNRYNYRSITGKTSVVETTDYFETDDVLTEDANKPRHIGSRWLLEADNLFEKTQFPLSVRGAHEAMKSGGARELRPELPGVRNRVVGEVEIPQIKSVLITSSVEEEGKSLISANLAITVAKDEPDKEILLIDCDMRKPRQHELFLLEKEPGLSSILTGKTSLSESIYQSELKNLWTIPGGDFVQSPPRLLSSKKARELIKACGNFFDMVIIDAPPIIPVNDPAVVAPYVDGVLLVVMAKKTFRETIQRAIELIETARANFLGIVLNKVDTRRGRYYYSYGYKSVL